MGFDPKLLRASLLGGDKFFLKNELKEDYNPPERMGYIASVQIRLVLDAILSGLWNEVAPMVPIAITHLELAILNNEIVGDSLVRHQKTLRRSKALGRWLVDGSPAVDDWTAAFALCETDLVEGGFTARELKSDCLDEFMAYCILAGEFETGVAVFERYAGAKSVSLKKTLSPRDFGYAMCLQGGNAQSDTGALFGAGKKMLAAYLPEWLRLSGSDFIAAWLKVVYGLQDPAPDAVATILRVYELLPDVAYPGTYQE